MIVSTRLVRITLWLSVAFNLAAAALFAFPGTPAGQLLGLPATVDVVYAAMTAWLITLFAAAYAWLAMQPEPDRPLLCLGAAGKSGVFLIAAGLWMAGYLASTLVMLASGDLVFAGLWFWWLAAGR